MSSSVTNSEELLVGTALIGIGKQAPVPLQAEHPVDQLLAFRTDLSPEQQILLRAGGRGIYNLAGTRARQVPPLAPAPREEGNSASARLKALLQGAFSPQSLPLLTEFLDVLHEHRIAFPHSLLPMALNCQTPARRGHLRQVLGSRARWLANLNPEWGWLLHDEEWTNDFSEWQRCFEEGGQRERVTALRMLRVLDAAAARELLQASLTTEKGEQKRKLVECLLTGLSLGDEDFLESLQRDRARKVRELAHEMLIRLPGSRFSQRHCMRVAVLFRWSASTAGGEKLEISLPDEIPADWQQDGLEMTITPGVGPRAALLRELVRRVPLSFWTHQFSKTPQDWIDAIETHEDASVIRSGWVEAMQTFGSITLEIEDWEQAFWGASIRQIRTERTHSAELSGSLTRLVEATAQTRLERVFINLLKQLPDVTQVPFDAWLAQLPIPWSHELSTAYLQTTRTLFRSRSDIATTDWSQTLVRAALGLSPTCFDQALEPWSIHNTSGSAWVATHLEALLRQLGEVIRIRREFRNEAARCAAAGESVS